MRMRKRGCRQKTAYGYSTRTNLVRALPEFRYACFLVWTRDLFVVVVVVVGLGWLFVLFFGGGLVRDGKIQSKKENENLMH